VRPERIGRAKSAIVRGQATWWIVRRRPEPAGGLRILTYHRVSTDRDELAVTPASFRRQIEAIAMSGVPVVDLASALTRDGSPAIALTFDDGYHDFVENALPVLVEHGFPATVFVCPEIVAGRARYSFYDPTAHPAMLTWDEMRVIERDTGVRFEPHSLTHPDLGTLDDDDAWREINGSRAALAAELGRVPRLFCYPGGYATGRDAALVERAGLVGAVTTEEGVNAADQPRYWLRRTAVDRYDPDWLFRARLRGALDGGVLGRRRRASA
jgi:peptidoglycan/xylan/chitin deacetylase (PgdA/CDA1 family)